MENTTTMIEESSEMATLTPTMPFYIPQPWPQNIIKTTSAFKCMHCKLPILEDNPDCKHMEGERHGR
jgi:hypothetical protein